MKNNKKILYPVILACVIILFIASLTIFFLSPEGLFKFHPDSHIIKTGWEYHWGDFPINQNSHDEWKKIRKDRHWKKIESYPARLPGRDKKQYLWLRVSLPKKNIISPTIYIKSIFTVFEVYFRESRIYSNSEVGTVDFAGLNRHLIMMPDNYHEDKIYFRVYSSLYYIGIQNSIILDSYADIVLDLFKEYLPNAVLAFLYIFIGIISLIIFSKLRRHGAYFYMGFSSIAAGLYVLRYTDIKEFFLDSPMLWIYIWLFSLAAFFKKRSILYGLV